MAGPYDAVVNGANTIAQAFINAPKQQAEGAVLQAHKGYYEAEAQLAGAKAAAEKDANDAYAALNNPEFYETVKDPKTGGTRTQFKASALPTIIALQARAGRSGHAYDLSRQTFNTLGSANAYTDPNNLANLVATGQANAADQFAKGQGIQTAGTNPDGTPNRPFLAGLAGGMHDLGGDVFTLGPDGKPIRGPVTTVGSAQARYYDTRGTNDTAETNAKVAAIGTKTEDGSRIAGAKVENIEGKTADNSRLTTAKVSNVEGKTSDNAKVADARAGAVTAKATTANPRNDLKLYEGIDKELTNRFAQLGVDQKSWAMLDRSELQSIKDRAYDYTKHQRMDVVSAIRKSLEDHNASGSPGDTTQGTTPKWGGLSSKPDGKLHINGFKLPDAPVSAAGSVSSAFAPSAPQAPAAAPAAAPAPQPKASQPKGQASQSGPVQITDTPEGRDAYARLPSGAKYIGPDGQTRTKR